MEQNNIGFFQKKIKTHTISGKKDIIHGSQEIHQILRILGENVRFQNQERFLNFFIVLFWVVQYFQIFLEIRRSTYDYSQICFKKSTEY